MHGSLWCRWETCWGRVCLSPMKKTAGTKGEKKPLSPVLAMGGEIGALPLEMDALCSPNTESWWGSPVLLTISRSGCWLFPQTTTPTTPPGLLWIPGSPGEQGPVAAQEAASQLETVNSSPQPPHDDG